MSLIPLRRWLLPWLVPLAAGVVGWADLAKPGYLTFDWSAPTLPDQRSQMWQAVSSLWQSWKTEPMAIAPTDSRLTACQNTLSPTRPIDRKQFLTLQTLIGQDGATVITALGQPCLLPNGNYRYLPTFLNRAIDLEFDPTTGTLKAYTLNSP